VAKMRAVVLHSAGDLRVEEHLLPAPDSEAVRVRIQAGGICGSDLHYFLHGGFGTVRVREPMILGHEVAGEVISAPEGSDLAPGTKVAVSPSRPCGTCEFCTEGQKNHCENMRFYGSARPMPHIQGAFCDVIDATPEQCFAIAPHLPIEIAAFAEPLAVVLHGLRRVGDIHGRRVVITGCGPIGALTVLAARAGGAAEVVVTDVTDGALQLATTLGADRAINVAKSPRWVQDYVANKGHFHVMIEASGNEAALRDGLSTLRPRGVLVQVGLGSDVALPIGEIVAKEIEIRGSFRFHEEFGDAVEALNTGRIDVAPLLGARFPVAETDAAFKRAAEQTNTMKIQLDFTT